MRVSIGTASQYQQLQRHVKKWTGKRVGPPRALLQQARASLLEWDDSHFQAVVQKCAVVVGKNLGKFVRQLAYWLLAKVALRTPVGVKEDWKYPSSAPAGYVGGKAKAGWHMENEQYYGSNPRAEVVNMVDHILMLEFGWSRQAPKGMMRISIRELTRIMRTKKFMAILGKMFG